MDLSETAMTPSAYTYDAAGRTTTLTTWRGAAGDAATAQVTTWTYSTHPTLPLVRSKKYPGRPIGIDYTYAADGSLATRDWERPDGSNRLRTTYSTNSFGQTTGVTYSNAAVTPPVAFAYDRAGRVRYRTDAAGTTLLEYRYDGTPLTETTVSAPNNDTPLAAGRHLRRTVDGFGRLTGLESAWGSTLGAVNVAGNGTVSPYVTYSYGTADRLSGIASGGMTGSIVRTSTTEAFQVTPQLNNFSQDYAYNRILRSSTTGQPSNHLAYVSGLGNLTNSNLAWDSDRLTSRGETDMNWNYAYDEKNQVKQAWKKFTASNSNAVVAGTLSQYSYDGIGNRTTLDEGGNGTTDSTTAPDWTQGLRQTKYFANELNQYTGIERPETFDVTGRRSNTNAAITVNGSGASYQGLYFRKEAANTPTPYTAGDVYEPVQVKEGTNTLTPDPDPVQFLGVPWRLTGTIPNPISYDVDGNLLTDGRWTYTWDGEPERSGDRLTS